MTTKIIAYFRVSTEKQGSGAKLGLHAQEDAVTAYAREHGVIVGRYEEVESGRKSDRPQLKAALAHARRIKGTLVVAKLDRLSRDAVFLLTLQAGKVPFVACDNPSASDLTVGLLAVIAQNEQRMISQRTKDALQAAKRRGVKLGSAREGHWAGKEDQRRAACQKARVRSLQVRRDSAALANAEIAPLIWDMRGRGLTLDAIAKALNEQGWETRRGKEWQEVHVSSFLKKNPVPKEVAR